VCKLTLSVVKGDWFHTVQSQGSAWVLQTKRFRVRSALLGLMDRACEGWAGLGRKRLHGPGRSEQPSVVVVVG